MINEIGTPMEFDLKEYIYGCERMINNIYPESVFLFKENECNFQIDYERKIFWVSDSILNYLNDNFRIRNKIYPSEQEIIESIKNVLSDCLEGKECEFEIKFWDEVNSVLLKHFIKEKKFKKRKNEKNSNKNICNSREKE